MPYKICIVSLYFYLDISVFLIWINFWYRKNNTFKWFIKGNIKWFTLNIYVSYLHSLCFYILEVNITMQNSSSGDVFPVFNKNGNNNTDYVEF